MNKIPKQIIFNVTVTIVLFAICALLVSLPEVLIK
jgi:hypothetical protein